MSGFSILAPTWTAGAIVTSNKDHSVSLKAQNTQAVQPSIFWRTNADTGIELMMDAGQARPWNGIYIGYNNGSSTGTVRANSHASTGALFSAPTFSAIQGIVLPGGPYTFPHQQTWLQIPTTQTFRYIGIEIEDAANPDGFFEAGVIVAGVVFTPKLGADIGSSHGFRDPSVAIELASNERVVRPKGSKMIGKFSFPFQDEEDTMQWDYLMGTFGSKVPMVFKWEPRVSSTFQRQTLFYGFASWGDITYVHAHGAWTVDVSIEEL